jgi:hypothetical protein
MCRQRALFAATKPRQETAPNRQGRSLLNLCELFLFASIFDVVSLVAFSYPSTHAPMVRVLALANDVAGVVVSTSTLKRPTANKLRHKAGRKADPKVIDCVSKFKAAHGRMPTVAEMRAAFPRMPGSTVYYNISRAA